ncbi:MAG: hypothetical protein ACI4F0_04435 [Agathobacter sp.]
MSRWNKQLLGKVGIGWMQRFFEAEAPDVAGFKEYSKQKCGI